MNIIKLGGAATSSSNISLILNSLAFDNRGGTILIISAFGKLSSDLKFVTKCLTSDFDINTVFKLFDQYSELLDNSYAIQFEKYLDSTKSRISEIVDGLRIIDEVPKESVDEVLSYGELVSSNFYYCLLKSKGIDCEFIDAREVIRTDSNFGLAKADISQSIGLIQNRIKGDKIIVTQGFIGSDINNRTTTMGFESSNLSALIFAKALESTEIDIIMKSDFIMSSDPEQIVNTKEVHSIPYESAIKLANSGFKLLYPGMIELAMKNGIELNYRSMYNNVGTQISNKKEFDLPVILEKSSTLIITPIILSKSIQIISEMKNYILNYEYDSENFTLGIKTTQVITQEVNDFILSLYEK